MLLTSTSFSANREGSWSLGTASLDNRLFVTLRYRHALFGARAAADFGDLYRDVLVSG